MKNNCWKCERRHVGCHATCEEYKEYVEKNKAVSRARFIETMKRRGSKKFEQKMINKIRRNGK